MNTEIVVKAAVEGSEIDDAIALLTRTLYTPYGFQFTTEDDLVERVSYVIALNGHLVVGAGRIRLQPNLQKILPPQIQSTIGQLFGEHYKTEIAQFYGLAVEQAYRSKGVGRGLYKIREQIARQDGKNIGLALVRAPSLPIYMSEGYISFGEVIEEVATGLLVRTWVAKKLET